MDFLVGGLTKLQSNVVNNLNTPEATILKHRKRLERSFMMAADAYSSGYGRAGFANLARVGISGAVAVAAWLILRLIKHLREKSSPDTEETNGFIKNDTSVNGTTLIVFILAFFLVGYLRRQKTFTNFAGSNTAKISGLTFAIPFSVLFPALYLSGTLDLQKSTVASLVFSSAALGIATKSFLPVRIDALEKNVFDQIAGVFDACPGASAATCNHRHHDYLTTYANSVRPLVVSLSRYLESPLEPSKVARVLSAKQNADMMSKFFKLF